MAFESGLERRFERLHAGELLPRARLAAATSVLLVVLFAVLDPILMPAGFSPTVLASRLVLQLLPLLLWWWATGQPGLARWMQPSGALCCLLLVLSIVAIVARARLAGAPVRYEGLVLVVMFFTAMMVCGSGPSLPPTRRMWPWLMWTTSKVTTTATVIWPIMRCCACCLRLCWKCATPTRIWLHVVVARNSCASWYGLEPATADALSQTLHVRVRALAIAHGGSDASPWVSLSKGMVQVRPSPALTSSDVLEQADQALYLAKHQGRNRRVIGSLQAAADAA